MRLQLCYFKLLSHLKKAKLFFALAFIVAMMFMLSSCTPYNGQLYSQGTISNEGTFISNGNTSTNINQSAPSFNGSNIINTSNSSAATNVNFSNATSTSHTFTLESGVQALFDCTEALGHNPAFTANDYQNCLQITQATLTDYALNLLKDYILTWADFAIDTALQALGFTNGRSYMTTQAKSSQLTSIIDTNYRWYN